MKVYIAMGTYEFLKKMKDAHPEQSLLFLQNENTCLLLHETEGNSLFKNPLKYEVIDGSGNFTVKQGFAVLHYIPVTDEGRPIFEYRFKEFSIQMERVPGFETARVLRPQASDTFCLLTIWNNAADFKKWQTSDMFNEMFSSNKTKTKSDKKLPQIFPRPAYMTKYSVEKE
jgi:heme-degrading monooxygenase HmoA